MELLNGMRNNCQEEASPGLNVEDMENVFDNTHARAHRAAMPCVALSRAKN